MSDQLDRIAKAYRDGYAAGYADAKAEFGPSVVQDVPFADFPERVGYLLKRGENGAAHIWDGTDTACRMASTGGLKLKKYVWHEQKPDCEICRNCMRHLAMRPEIKTPDDVPERWIVGERFHELRVKFPPITGVPPWEGEDCLAYEKSG